MSDFPAEKTTVGLTMEEYTFDAPLGYASPLINGDCSGMNDDDQAEFDAWVEKNPELARDVVDCAEESFIGPWNGLGTELVTFRALRRSNN